MKDREVTAGLTLVMKIANRLILQKKSLV